MTAFAALALVAVQAVPVFPTRVELVYVDVFVTRKDAPVAGLASADFRLQDNGVAQQVEVVDRAVVPTTAVLVLDVSASVEGAHFVHLRSAARSLLAALGERDEAALVTFNTKVLLRQDATRDVLLVSAALDRVSPGGGTALIDALFVSLKRRWGTGRPVIVLFTDGRDSASWLDNEDVVEAARESSALLHVVGTEAEWQRDPEPDLVTLRGGASKGREFQSGYVNLLRRAAEITGGGYWPVGSTADLPTTFERIMDAASARYVLRYEPTGVPRTGRHQLKVAVQRRGVEVRARQEYVVAASAPQ